MSTTMTGERFTAATVLDAAHRGDLYVYSWHTGGHVVIDGIVHSESHWRAAESLYNSDCISSEHVTDHIGCSIWRFTTTEKGREWHSRWFRLANYRAEND